MIGFQRPGNLIIIGMVQEHQPLCLKNNPKQPEVTVVKSKDRQAGSVHNPHLSKKREVSRSGLEPGSVCFQSAGHPPALPVLFVLGLSGHPDFS